jgi:hypothetical protein
MIAGELPRSPQLEYNTFSQLLNEVFKVRLDKQRNAGLLLTEVKRGKSDPRVDYFHLRFRGVSGQILSQGTYCFQHQDLGRFSMFIVPNAGKAGAPTYEAVFNRLIT